LFFLFPPILRAQMISPSFPIRRWTRPPRPAVIAGFAHGPFNLRRGSFMLVATPVPLVSTKWLIYASPKVFLCPHFSSAVRSDSPLFCRILCFFSPSPNLAPLPLPSPSRAFPVPADQSYCPTSMCGGLERPLVTHLTGVY